MKRIVMSLGATALLVAALLTFPEYIHWMPLAWLLAAAISNSVNGRIWPWLLSCLIVVVIKRPGFNIGFYVFAAGFLLATIIDLRSTGQPDKKAPFNRSVSLWPILFLATAIFGFSRWFDSNTSVQLKMNDRPIACLGDSLTDYGYPEVLATRITVPVADFGFDGITTNDGIAMIQDILAADPQLVVIELGGHDYNSGQKNRHATKANLAQLIEAFLDKNIAVVLVEIPRGFITDPFSGLERELAAKHDLQLIDDSLIRSFIFYSPIIPPGAWLDPSRQYSEDGLHPNALGNELFANKVLDALKRVYGSAVEKNELSRE